MSVNTVSISGNLGKDPEVRTTASGMSILTFNLAVNERVKNKQSGEYESYTNWITVTVFGKRAEWLSRDLHKGKRVMVQGRLHYSSWEKDGTQRSKVEVIADEIDYERPPRQQQGYQQQNYQPQQQYQQQYTRQSAPQDVYDEDLPF